MLKHFLQFKDLSRDELLYLFERARLIKSTLQEIPAVSPAGRPHAGDDFREKLDSHPAVVRSGHAPARRHGDLSQHARHPTGARRAGGGCGRGHFAHGRHRDDPHLRAGDHRTLRRALARAGDQRAHQRIPSVPDSGRHLHLHRASRRDPGQDGGVDRRFQQHVQHLAAGGRSARIQRACVDPAGLRSRAGTRRTLWHRPFRELRRPDGRLRAVRIW